MVAIFLKKHTEHFYLPEIWKIRFVGISEIISYQDILTQPQVMKAIMKYSPNTYLLIFI